MIFLWLLLAILGSASAAMAETYYLSDTNITTPLETLATSAPSSVDSAQGWTVATKVSGSNAAYRPDTVITRTSNDWGGEPSAFTALGYRTSAALTGMFPAGNWVLSFKVKSNTYYAQKGYVKYRLWRGTNAAGTGATQITSGWQSSTLVSFTAANQNQTGTITVNPGVVVLAGEYLFLEIEWACNNSGGNNGAIVYWVHNEGSAEQLTTPTFAPVFLSMTATNGAVTSTVTAAEVVNNSVAATLGKISSDITANMGVHNSASVDATIGKTTSNISASFVVGNPRAYDIGAFEQSSGANMVLFGSTGGITADIQVFYPNDTVRFDVRATTGAVTSDVTANEGASASITVWHPIDPAAYDIGSFETYKGIPFSFWTADIEVSRLNQQEVDLSVSATLPKLTGNIAAIMGGKITMTGTLGKLTSTVNVAEVVNISEAGTLGKLTAQMDVIGNENVGFITPEPNMSTQLNLQGASPLLNRR